MELTRKQIIALIISTSEKESPFALTYDIPAYKGLVPRSKEKDCWDLRYLYDKLEYRLFGGSHERGFQMITFINEAEARSTDVVFGFQQLENDICQVVNNQEASNLPTPELIKTKCIMHYGRINGKCQRARMYMHRLINYPAASGRGILLRKIPFHYRRKRRGIQPKEIEQPT